MSVSNPTEKVDFQTASPREIKDQQRFLKSRGFDPGQINGEFNDWTARARRSFDKAQDKNFSVQGMGPRLQLATEALRMVGPHTSSQRNPRFCTKEALSCVSSPAALIAYSSALLFYLGKRVFGDQNPFPRSMWSSDMVRDPSWSIGHGLLRPQVGDLFGMFYKSLDMIGHCGMILYWPEEGPYFLSFESQFSEKEPARFKNDVRFEFAIMKRRNKCDVFQSKDWISGSQVDLSTEALSLS